MQNSTRRDAIRTIVAGGLAAGSVLSPGQAQAALQKVYKCKIVNNTGVDVLVRIYHYRRDITYSTKLKNGDSVITDPATGEGLAEGWRGVVAWDDFQETIVAIGKVEVVKKTVISLNANGTVVTAFYDESL